MITRCGQSLTRIGAKLICIWETSAGSLLFSINNNSALCTFFFFRKQNKTKQKDRCRSSSPTWKNPQTNNPASLKLLHCVLSGPECTNTHYKLLTLCPPPRLPLFKVSFDTVVFNFISGCFEKLCVRKSHKTRYLGPLPFGSGAASELRPLLSVLARVALQIWPCLAISFADPVIALLIWLPGLASDLLHHYRRFCVISLLLP